MRDFIADVFPLLRYICPALTLLTLARGRHYFVRGYRVAEESHRSHGKSLGESMEDGFTAFIISAKGDRIFFCLLMAVMFFNMLFAFALGFM